MVRKTSLVLVLGAAATPASATLLLHEPFNYGPEGTEISTADGQGGWLKVPSAATLEPTIAADSLGYPGLPWTPAGNKVAMTGGATAVQASSTRAIPGQPYLSADQPTLYYALLLNVSDVAGAATGAGSFIAGFRNNGSTSGLAGAEAGAPLLIRQTTAGSGTYQLGTGLTQENADRKWDSTSYTAADTLLVVLGYQFVDNGPDFARLWINPDPTQSEADNSGPGGAIGNALKVIAEPTTPDRTGIREGRITNVFLRNNGAAPDAFAIDELRVANSWEGIWSTGGVDGIWLGGVGNWSDATKWSGGNVPILASTPVQIDSNNAAIASVVTMDQDVTVRSISLDAGDALNVPAGRTLTLSSPFTVNGIVNNSGTINAAGIAIAGGELRYDAGTVSSTGSVALSAGGKLLMAAGANKVLKATTLSISSTSTLDLSDNKLITSTAIGTFNGTVYSGVHGEVARAYNFGSWDQPGITTSQERAGQNAGPFSGTTTLGINSAQAVLFLENPTDTGVWAGQTVTGTDTIVMYTYAGDMNFDGIVDGADYGFIDNSVQFPGTDGYSNGDLNYDGVIDGADYGIIDNTIQLQGDPIPTGIAPSAVVAVPEPVGILPAAAAAAMLLKRRRRRRSV